MSFRPKGKLPLSALIISQHIGSELSKIHSLHKKILPLPFRGRVGAGVEKSRTAIQRNCLPHTQNQKTIRDCQEDSVLLFRLGLAHGCISLLLKHLRAPKAPEQYGYRSPVQEDGWQSCAEDNGN